VSKNWPSDLRVGCKSPSNLVELIQRDLDFEEELEEFKVSFEWDEIVDILNVEKKNLNKFICNFVI
jgi:hypothetical protein